MSSTDLNLLHS